MQTVTTIGLDIAKSVFQVHGVDAAGQMVIRRQLKRRYMLAFFEKLPPCLIGIEACASSHHWSRELQALGHSVRLMPPAYVKPYVKRQKNDATDAEAICEAVARANMRFVPTKTPVQQSGLVLHRTRQLFIRQLTAVTNAIRAHLAGFGIVAPVGRNGVEELLLVVADKNDKRLPEVARVCLAALGVQLRRFTQANTRMLAAGADIYSNETIRTGPSGVADLRFNDTSGLSVGPTSVVRLDKFVYDPNKGAGSITIEASRGAFRFVTSSQNKGDYKVRTPFGTLGVRG